MSNFKPILHFSTCATEKKHRQLFGGATVAIILWLAVVVSGTVLMVRYSSTPGDSGTPPAKWPVATQIPFDSQKPTLIMFTHPQCACSRASVGELEVLLSRFPNRLNAHVVFLKPEGTSLNWEKSGLWQKASAIPGVVVHTDVAGAEAQRFHVETSGQTLLYDPSGVLRFQGGITAARGHSGDNEGRGALESMLRDGHFNSVKTPVYGCSLFESKCK